MRHGSRTAVLDPTGRPHATLHCKRVLFGLSEQALHLHLVYNSTMTIDHRDNACITFKHKIASREAIESFGRPINDTRVFRASDITCVSIHDGNDEADVQPFVSPSVMLQTQRVWRRTRDFAVDHFERDWIVVELSPAFDREALQLLRDLKDVNQPHTHEDVNQPLASIEARELIIHVEKRALFLRERRVLALEAREAVLCRQEARMKMMQAELDKREGQLNNKHWQLSAKQWELDKAQTSLEDQTMEAERMLESNICSQLQIPLPLQYLPLSHNTTQTEAPGIGGRRAKYPGGNTRAKRNTWGKRNTRAKRKR